MNEMRAQKNSEPDVERAYCKVCGAVYFARSWKWNDAKRNVFEKDGLPSLVCSACYKIRNDLPSGILSFIGVKDKMKMSEMIREAKSIAKEVEDRDPLARIIRVIEKSDETVIYTTDGTLAKKIGRHLTRTYVGSLSVDDSDSNLTRAVWISKEQ